MRKLKLLLLVNVFTVSAVATTLTGSLAPPNSNATGTLILSLSGPATISRTCGGGGANTNNIEIHVISGAMQSPPVVTGNDCLLPPGTNYNVIFTDSTTGVQQNGVWTITGSTFSISTQALGLMGGGSQVNGAAIPANAVQLGTNARGQLIPVVGGALTNPMTSVGDLIVGSTAGAPIRLGAGSGYLHWTGSAFVYDTPPGGGSTIANTTNVICGTGTGNGAACSFAPAAVILSTATYNDPSWITGLAWSKIVSPPAFATYPGAGVPNSTGSAWGTSYTTSGSGTVLCLTTSCTMVTPALGTPSAIVLTNATGLPLATGVTGNLTVSHLNSGTGASGTTFWRGDGTWGTPAGGVTVPNTTNVLVGNNSGGILAATGTGSNCIHVDGSSGACGGAGITFQTNGTPNGSQTLLNLKAGTNLTLTDNGSGQITIDATGGGGTLALQAAGSTVGNITTLNIVNSAGVICVPTAVSTTGQLTCATDPSVVPTMTAPIASGQLVFGTGTGTVASGTNAAYDNSTGNLTLAGTTTTVAVVGGGTIPSVGTCGTIGANSKNAAGFITSATTGSCVSVVTFTATAPHGWSCAVSNSTTANLIRQSGSSATTATFTGVTVSGDVLPYACSAY